MRRPFLVLFPLFLLTTTASAAWHPLYSAPDEPSHVIRAAAVARGQFRYAEQTPAPGLLSSEVRVPRVFADSIYAPQCFFFKVDVPASCAAPLAGEDDVRGVTQAGRYPPLYYVLVGAPSLVWKSNLAVYAMRFLHAVLCSVFLAQGFAIALRLRGYGDRRSRGPSGPAPQAPRAGDAAVTGRRRMPEADNTRDPSAQPLRNPLLVAAVAVATTPMVVYLASVVNPSGVEIAAATCLWTALAAVGVTRDLSWRGPLPWAVVSAVAVASARPIGPLWVLVAVAFTMASGALSPLRPLLRTRAVQAGAVVVALAAGATLVWVATLGGAGLTGAPLDDPGRAPLLSLGLTGQRLGQMVAYYGWLDAPVPIALQIAWGLVLAGLVAFAVLAARSLRLLVSVGVLAVAVLLVPMVFEVLQADEVGLFWQGRYSLPVAVGVPILAAAGTSRLAGSRLPARWPLVVMGVTLLAVHVVAIGAAIRRFAVGMSGPILFFLDSDWSPPIPHLALAGAFVTGLAGITIVVSQVGLRRTHAT